MTLMSGIVLKALWTWSHLIFTGTVWVRKHSHYSRFTDEETEQREGFPRSHQWSWDSHHIRLGPVPHTSPPPCCIASFFGEGRRKGSKKEEKEIYIFLCYLNNFMVVITFYIFFFKWALPYTGSTNIMWSRWHCPCFRPKLYRNPGGFCFCILASQLSGCDNAQDRQLND